MRGGHAMPGRIVPIAAVVAAMVVGPVPVGWAQTADVKVVVSRDVRDGDPVALVSVFTGTDPQACVHVTLFDVHGSHLIRWEVYRPDGSTYRTAQVKTRDPGHGYSFSQYRTWRCWSIAEAEPGFTVGLWTVKVFLDRDLARNVSFDIISVGAAGEDKLQARLQAMKARVQASPSDPWAHVDLADAYMDLHEFDEAMAELKQALTLDPQQASAHATLGYLYRRQGALDEAERSLLRATELESTYSWAHYQLAFVYKEKGDKAKAIEQFRIVVKIEGDTSLGKAAQDELAKLVESLMVKARAAKTAM